MTAAGLVPAMVIWWETPHTDPALSLSGQPQRASWLAHGDQHGEPRHHTIRRQTTAHSRLGRRHGLIRGVDSCAWIATEFHHNPDDGRQHEGDSILG